MFIEAGEAQAEVDGKVCILKGSVFKIERMNSVFKLMNICIQMMNFGRWCGFSKTSGTSLGRSR